MTLSVLHSLGFSIYSQIFDDKLEHIGQDSSTIKGTISERDFSRISQWRSKSDEVRPPPELTKEIEDAILKSATKLSLIT